MGVEGVHHPRHVQLGRRHDRGHRGVHLCRRPQLLPGEVAGHQWKTRGPILPHSHGEHIKGLGDGDIPRRQIGPQHAVGSDCHRGHPWVLRCQLPRRPEEGVRHQLPQGISLLDARLRPRQGEVRPGQHLVIGQVVAGQIIHPHLGLPLLHQGGDLLVLRQGLVDRDQLVVHQGLASVLRPLQSVAPQILAVGPGGDDIGISLHNGLGEGGVGMAREDQVDPLHLPGQLLVLRLPLPLVGPAVGQRDDKLRTLLLQAVHAALGRLHRVLQREARSGGAVVRVGAHQAENAVGDPAPLQQ